MQEMNQSSRPDNTTSKLVEQGIVLLHSRDRSFASEFLLHRGVPVDVIVRVMSEPRRRRSGALRR